MDKADSILIVGSGVFGVSTAWHLARKGYTNILCIDPYAYPSKLSAGNDISKVIRTQYKNPLYAKLAHEALAEWNQAPLSSAFHRSGIAYLNSSRIQGNQDPTDAAGGLAETFKDVGKYGDASLVRELKSGADVQEVLGITTDMSDFIGWFDGNNGWATAHLGLKIVADEAAKLGVRFLHGDSATMKELLRDDNDNVIGIIAKDGTRHLADRTLFAVGGWSESLLDFEGQLLSGAYSVTHIDLTPDEAAKYRHMPVVAVDGLGFVLPPNEDDILKACDLEPGKTNLVKLPGRDGLVSVPDSKAYEGGRIHTLPKRDQDQSRAILKYTHPEFQDRPLSFSRLCWDTQSFDGSWIIGPHPSSPDTFFIATGGSGHAYKNLPTLGRYIAEMMEGALDPELKEAWRWRPDRVQGAVPLSLYDLNDPNPPEPRL